MADAVTPPVLPHRRVGRYALYDEIGHGGTASVHLGRLWGAANFSRTVAIKQMHAHVGRDAAVSAMFLDEARLSSRIAHASVVPIHDLVAIDGDLFLVMDYVVGESLANLLQRQRETAALDSKLAVKIVVDALTGLHAAHEAKDERGGALGLVHRDVSPHNLLVGIDGRTRVLDFGIAKATGRLQETSTGQVKGKIAYMAPEQLLGQELDRRVDVFAAGIVLWECLAGRKLFSADSLGEAVQRVLEGKIPRLADFRADVSPELEAVVERALAFEPSGRFATAAAFAEALGRAASMAASESVGAWVVTRGGDALAHRVERLRAIEAGGPPPEGRFAPRPSSSAPIDSPVAVLGDETVSFVGSESFVFRDATPRPEAEKKSAVEGTESPKRSLSLLPLGIVALAVLGFFGTRVGAKDETPSRISNAHPAELEPPRVPLAVPASEPAKPALLAETVKAPLTKGVETKGAEATSVQLEQRASAKSKATRSSAPLPAASGGKRAEDLFSRN